MKNIILFLGIIFFTISNAQRGEEMMLASYVQANQIVVVSTSSMISASTDDYEEESITGASPFGTTSSDLEIGYGSASFPKISIGLRFLGLNIPQGATITNAYIQFSAERTSSGTSPIIEIYGINEDNTATFVATTGNLSGRVKTTAMVGWTGLPAWTVGERGVNQRTADISTLVQEIVNRAGYTSASAIGIEVRTASNNSTFTRRGKSYNLSTTEAPQLFVTYETTL